MIGREDWQQFSHLPPYTVSFMHRHTDAAAIERHARTTCTATATVGRMRFVQRDP